MRECLEEIGVSVIPIKKIAETEESSAVHHWFEAKIVSGEATLANDENSALKWGTIAEIQLLSPVTDEDLRILITHFG